MTSEPSPSARGGIVRAMIAEAKPVAVPAAVGPALGQALNGMAPGQWKEAADQYGMPPGCPFVPLGIADGAMYFLDQLGQIRTLAEPYGKGHLLGLALGEGNYLAWAWPREGRRGVDGFEALDMANCLLGACKTRGLWDGAEKLRGRGIWASRRDELVVHLGDELRLGMRPLATNELDGFIYPARPAIPGPWPEKVEPAASPLRLLMPLLRRWNWKRPEIDPVLLLGWIGAAWLGGALKFRPAIFVTGDKGTGKSTLQELLKTLFGPALIQAADTTAAGIYQRVRQDCLPVAIDEMEAEADTKKQKAILTLQRLAATGALMFRGGDRHQGVEFQARNCFLFSSINAPPLEPANLSRLALLQLQKLKGGKAKLKMDPQTFANVGRMILRRLIDQWPRFEETVAAFQAELAEAGMDSRAQDTFGTLLACQDLILHDGWDEERLRHPTAEGELVPWRDLMKVESMIEFEDQTENWRGCLDHMLSVQVDAWRNGTRKTVGQVLFDYFNAIDQLDITQARTLLAQAGLTIVLREDRLKEAWLAVPNQNPLTRTLFLGSKWAGDIGAAVWAGALRQGPPDLCEPGRARVNGVVGRATLISLKGLYGPGGLMAGG